jgi:hypothetical protein
MAEDERRGIFCQVADLLEAGNESFLASAVRDKCSASDQEFEAFLISNELFGGSGSLADSAFAFRGDPYERELVRKKHRAEFEGLMIQLGRRQLAQGKANVRNSRWVDAFEKWKRAGVYGEPA